MKKSVRREVQAVLDAISPEDVARRSAVAAASMTRLPAFQSAGVVMAYLAMPAEADPAGAMREAWRSDKTVLCPRMSAGEGCMEARVMTSLQATVTISTLGIREPAETEMIAPERIDFVIVPGLAFDRRGRRLGRGGGYYDRFLARLRDDAVRCGFALREQLLDDVPIDDHDQPIDLLVTDEGVLRFAPRVGQGSLGS